MSALTLDLHPSWNAVLGAQFEQAYMQALLAFLRQELAAGKDIFPPLPLWFNAFNSTPFDKVKVVIIGQDPYPTPGHAHGLSFSVLPDVTPLPRSLQNINKELLDDVGIDNSATGYLQPWAEQGVLLLNAILTVERGNAGAHQKRGWQRFTDAAIESLSAQREGLVFLLWGRFAQSKAALIDANRHHIIASAHPSPLSARRGFFGSKPFSRINDYLAQGGQTPIEWNLRF